MIAVDTNLLVCAHRRDAEWPDRAAERLIAALCLASGVETLWTADRDLSRFSALRAVNPLTREPS